MSRPGSLDACGCGAELIFVSQDKFTCCQWAASMQELQFLCYPHNSLLPGCRSSPRRGVLERREGAEDEPPLDFLSEEEEERECPVVGQCEWEIMPPPPPSPRSSLLPNSQSSTSSGFFLKLFLCTSQLLASSVMGKEFGALCLACNLWPILVVLLIIVGSCREQLRSSCAWLVRSTAVNRPGFHRGTRRKPPREEALGMAVCGARGRRGTCGRPGCIPSLGVTV